MTVLYRPADSVLADVIPFYNDGVYHLFYLRDWRDPAGHGEGVPWWHLTTRDFVTFEDVGEAIPRGPIGSQDAWIFTGCVIEHGGLFHIFYTGHNHHLTKIGRPAEAVMHATSTDLTRWKKDEGFAFFAPREGYAPDDWRDPFVFWNQDAGEFWMLLAARQTQGPSHRRGRTALCASKDLKHWDVREPFWAPDQFFTHECPDLFRMGEWWYLIFSEFSDRVQTRYRMSQSLDGPWIAPPDDALDTRAYYAAKSAGDGRDRFLFGWIPTRVGEKDSGNYQWGGTLVVHQIEQQQDGTLSVRMPAGVAQRFSASEPIAPGSRIGAWQVEAGVIRADAIGRASTLTMGALPDSCMIEARIDIAPGGLGAGLLLHADEKLEQFYSLTFEPQRGRIVLDRMPRAGDQPPMFERALPPWTGGPVSLRVIVEGTCLVVYINDRVALSSRLYDHTGGTWALHAHDARAAFAGVRVIASK